MTRTCGSVEVESIEIGNTLYEDDNGKIIKSIVKTQPILCDDRIWRWECVNAATKEIIEYEVCSWSWVTAPALYGYNIGLVREMHRNES